MLDIVLYAYENNWFNLPVQLFFLLLIISFKTPEYL
jgi:hypothetical protein